MGKLPHGKDSLVPGLNCAKENANFHCICTCRKTWPQRSFQLQTAIAELGSVLPGSDKHSRPHSLKSTATFGAFTATYQKICTCMIFQSTTTIKNTMFGEGFCNFLISALHSWIKHGNTHHRVARVLSFSSLQSSELGNPSPPPPRCMYPKCGNLYGQRGRKQFLASWGLRMSHICPCTPCPSPPWYRS